MIILRIILAFGLSIAGGIVGAMLLGAAGQAPLQHTVDWGTLVAGLAATLGALYLAQRAVDEYIHRQERDEVSRRFVDEGIDRLGRELAAAYAAQINNLRMVATAASLARGGDREGAMAHLQAAIPSPPSARFESMRFLTQIQSDSARRLFDLLFIDLDFAFTYASQVLPSMIRSALSEAENADLRDTAEQVLVVEGMFSGRLRSTQDRLLEGLAELSLAFQAARVARTSDALNWTEIPRLQTPIARFSAMAAAALNERRKWEDTPETRERIRLRKQQLRDEAAGAVSPGEASAEA